MHQDNVVENNTAKQRCSANGQSAGAEGQSTGAEQRVRAKGQSTGGVKSRSPHLWGAQGTAEHRSRGPNLRRQLREVGYQGRTGLSSGRGVRYGGRDGLGSSLGPGEAEAG